MACRLVASARGVRRPIAAIFGAMDGLASRYAEVRRQTEALVEPLSAEDCQVQSMPDASPAKWHLAHTSWFFETFVLAGRAASTPAFGYLFNSYYEAVGRAPSARRARPALAARRSTRCGATGAQVDERVLERLGARRRRRRRGRGSSSASQHEQQHQELILTDIKHAPRRAIRTRPAYRARAERRRRAADAAPLARCALRSPARRRRRDRHDAPPERGRAVRVRQRGPAPRGAAAPFALASRLVTCGEYLAFVRDGGYRRPELWLSDGWAQVAAPSGWEAPLYWGARRRRRLVFTLDGERAARSATSRSATSATTRPTPTRAGRARGCRPRRSGRRAAARAPGGRQPARVGGAAPARRAGGGAGGLAQLFGDVWEWTASAYVALPGLPAGGRRARRVQRQVHVQPDGAARRLVPDAADATSAPSYRNFFPPAARWQLTGIRLARDA